MRILTVLLGCLISVTVSAQQKANYDQAAKFSPDRLNKMLFSLGADARWLAKSNRFWYTYETTQGKTWNIVDPAKKSKQALFDNHKMAAMLTRIVKDPFDAQHLVINNLKFLEDENWISFEVPSTLEVPKKVKDTASKKDSTVKTDTVKTTTRATGRAATARPAMEKKTFYFHYNIITGELKEQVDYEKPKQRPRWANISPDSSIILFGRNYNLWTMDLANFKKAMENEDDSTIVETQITTDGLEYYSFHGGGSLSGSGETDEEKEKNKKKRQSVFVYWSDDSQHFTISRSDTRKVKDFWVINSIAAPRPTIETYKYWMPGEKDGPIEELFLGDSKAKKLHKIDVSAFKDQTISVYSKPSLPSQRDIEFRPAQWLGTNGKFYLSRTSRDLKKIDILIADVATKSVKPLIEERMNTYLETRRLGLVNNGKELIHWSEQDGWGHFYLYDENGKLKNQITSGPYHCEDIRSIDEKKRVLYFTANGREKGEDPYLLHLYKVNFDGSGLQLLDVLGYDNTHSPNDDNSFFVTNYSNVNTQPKTALFDGNGKKVLDLEEADLSSLLASGYKFPEPFTVKADDGITDLFGVMYKPFDFDSTKKYPLIQYVYPGPQTEAVNKAFSKGMDRMDRLAQLGFIVVTVGNRGGHPSRSKWYHNYGYGNLRDYGLADKKTAAEQLADRYSFIDINKVGIHGHSGGGFMSTAAMLVYPDFFKVAVSNAGNHDNNIYNRWWSEKHHGVDEKIDEKGDTTFVYKIESNPEVAKNLKGHLLLIHGEIDNNVHPANTMRVVNALIKANKRFEMLLLPTQRHGFGNMSEYWFWKTADYFSKWLLDDHTDRPVDITEINRDTPQRR